jgi:hypothetical protein
MPKVLGLEEYNPYSSRRRLLDHVRVVLRTYASLLPLTVRQIYYRLVATHDEYPKEQKFYAKLVDTLARARRGGLIKWSAIRDDGVSSYLHGGGFNDLANFKAAIELTADRYALNKHINQPRQIFLLCEAAGMIPQLQRAVGDYPVTVQSSGGMDSVTAKYDLARACCKKDSVVLHVGDYDPTGLTIFHQLALDVKRMIVDMVGYDAAPSYECKRIAVLQEHVAEHGLLTGRMKAADASKDWYPGIAGDLLATCEVEALPPDVLIAMVKAAVEAEIDMDAYKAALEKEKDERATASFVVKHLDFGGSTRRRRNRPTAGNQPDFFGGR